MSESPVDTKKEFGEVSSKKPDQSAIDDHLYDDDNEYEDDEDDWLDMECGLMADGQCGMAGTEHCDFVCPNRNSEDFCGSAAWNKKHEAAR